MTLFFKTQTKQKAWLVLGLLALCQATVVNSVYAQSSRDVTSRLNRIENEIETLNRAVYRGEKPPSSGGLITEGNAGYADMQVRVQQLEIELRDLRGMLEQQNHDVARMREQLDRSLGDMELRFQEMDRRSGSVGGGASSSQGYTTNNSGGAQSSTYIQGRDVTTTPNAPANNNDSGFSWRSRPDNGASSSVPSGETAPVGGRLGTLSSSANSADPAAQAYEKAFSLLQNSRYEEAGQEFENFLSQHRDHALASNAKYWLGESYYVRGDYQKSARIFAEGYQEFPKGSKAADNLLKLGMSLSALGKKDDACIALGQLKQNYVAESAPVVHRAEQEMGRLGCSA
jgi:tol-pal system protein YbgF